MKISFEPHPEAARVRHPRVAGVVLLVLAAASLALYGAGVWALRPSLPLTAPLLLGIILAASGIWNLRRAL